MKRRSSSSERGPHRDRTGLGAPPSHRSASPPATNRADTRAVRYRRHGRCSPDRHRNPFPRPGSGRPANLHAAARPRQGEAASGTVQASSIQPLCFCFSPPAETPGRSISRETAHALRAPEAPGLYNPRGKRLRDSHRTAHGGSAPVGPAIRSWYRPRTASAAFSMRGARSSKWSAPAARARSRR